MFDEDADHLIISTSDSPSKVTSSHLLSLMSCVWSAIKAPCCLTLQPPQLHPQPWGRLPAGPRLVFSLCRAPWHPDFLPHSIPLCQEPIPRGTIYLGTLAMPIWDLHSPSCKPWQRPQSHSQPGSRLPARACLPLWLYPIENAEILLGDTAFLYPMESLSNLSFLGHPYSFMSVSNT